MRKLSQINESLFSDVVSRGEGRSVRKEDDYIKTGDWWRNIPLENPTKYPARELKATDILYDVVERVKKTLGIKNIECLTFKFRHENWTLVIEHFTGYGNDKYNMHISGDRGYNWLRWKDLDIDEKRSIKQRLETFNLYLYKFRDGDYILREDSEYKGQKGILLQK